MVVRLGLAMEFFGGEQWWCGGRGGVGVDGVAWVRSC